MNFIKRFILASGNKKKLAELRDVLQGMGLELVSREEAGINHSPEETGSTFEENALIKAGAAADAGGMPCIADDSGLCVDALGGAPGVFSARFEQGASYGEKNRRIIEMLEGSNNRKARFVCVIACVFPTGEHIIARGECEGEIAMEPRGTGGFGYDPVFIVSNVGKTMAELSKEEKNLLSHRGRALMEFEKRLREYYVNQ